MWASEWSWAGDTEENAETHWEWVIETLNPLRALRESGRELCWETVDFIPVGVYDPPSIHSSSSPEVGQARQWEIISYSYIT